MQGYVDRLCAEMAGARSHADALQAILPERADSIFFGGGTPTLLAPNQLRQIFEVMREKFAVDAGAEITVECAPGQLPEETLEELLQQGMNRISFGVQSFVDVEAASVGRLHSGELCCAEIERVRSAGLRQINVDLIAGLPHQTHVSWQHSLDEAVASGAQHVSVYMLEVDEDSRLGREVMAGGTRYHAHSVPDEELTAELYLQACERLEAAGIHQYEISNFAKPGRESRHNLKYWQRKPYRGFGLDAHSMLETEHGSAICVAVRFANTDDLNLYELSTGGVAPQRITRQAALEEAVFLGLRLNTGIDLADLAKKFGENEVSGLLPAAQELREDGLMQQEGTRIRLTARGRLLSNDVFARMLEAVPA